MKKDSYAFPSKRLYRQHLLAFSERLLKFRKPEDLKVACFPGHEGLEIKEVYDKMRIPRSNIVGLEQMMNLVPQIQENVPGIQVLPVRALDYFKECKSQFDIINLDFQGMLNGLAQDTLTQICAKHLVRNGGILGTNFFGARESRDLQNSYICSSNLPANIRTQMEHNIKGHFGYDLPKGNIPKFDNLSDARGQGITHLLLHIIVNAGTLSDFDKFCYKVCDEHKFSTYDMYLQVEHAARIAASEALVKVYPVLKVYTPGQLWNITAFLMLSSHGSYMPKDIERNTYFTENGKNKMYCDFFQISDMWYKYRTETAFFDFKEESVGCRPGPESLNSALKKYVKYLEEFPIYKDFKTIPSREHLVPEKNKPLSRKDVIELLCQEIIM